MINDWLLFYREMARSRYMDSSQGLGRGAGRQMGGSTEQTMVIQ